LRIAITLENYYDVILMGLEQKITPESFRKTLTPVVFVYTLVFLSKFSFSRDSARKVKERAGGKCQGCGKTISPNDQIAAHLNHDRSSTNYDNPNIGRCFCPFCEMSFHYNNHGNPLGIGIKDQAVNRSIIVNWYYALSPDEKRMARDNFGEPFKKLVGIR